MSRNSSLKLASIVLAGAALLAGPAAHAATATGSLAVSATVLSTCLVASTPIVFGNYTLGSLDASGLITVTCTPDITAYNVALNAGVGAGSTTAVRKMTSVSTSDTLSYGLFRDNARTQNWGDVPNVDTILASAATTNLGAIKTFAVYGRLGANQTVSTGAYLDTVQVTINY
jgi:spore coat protein U-like protein